MIGLKIIDDLNKVEQIRSLIVPGSTIAVHGVTSDSDNHRRIILSIMYGNGLNTNKNSNIYYNCSVKGKEDSLENALNYMYADNNGTYTNIVFAIPDVIENSNGETIFMGSLPKDSGGYVDKYNRSFNGLLINKFIEEQGYIPKEFILGFVVGKYNSDGINEEFVVNPHYIGCTDIIDRRKFGDSFLEKCSLGYDIDDYNLTNVDLNKIEDKINAYARFGQRNLILEQIRDYLIEQNNKTLR